MIYSASRHVPPGSDFIDVVASPYAMIWVFFGLLLIASAGGLVGILTRKTLALIGTVTVLAGILIFHDYLPLPSLVHLELNAFKSRIGLK